MDGLTPGRIVHYVIPGIIYYHAAAIVVYVHPTEDNMEPLVDLSVFESRPKDSTAPVYGVADVRFSETKEDGTWHWIERA